MTLLEFSKAYNLYGSIIVSWNWHDAYRLILEIELANFNQPVYTRLEKEFRRITLIFKNCVVTDLLDKKFSGFSSGDARIIAANKIEKSPDVAYEDALEIVCMLDRYDGREETLVSIRLNSSEVILVDK